jgi:hypothetical protein
MAARGRVSLRVDGNLPAGSSGRKRPASDGNPTPIDEIVDPIDDDLDKADVEGLRQAVSDFEADVWQVEYLIDELRAFLSDVDTRIALAA